MKILLFGGTGEGRALAHWLQQRNIPFLLSVATAYGEAMVEESIPTHVGRLDEAAMAELMEAEGITHVIDATHPYAVAVTETIERVCGRLELPRYRLVRDGDQTGDWLQAESTQQAGEMLQNIPGNILLTVGAKELDAYALPELVGRSYPRVLPSLDSLERALSLGFPPSQVICMQGPFSRELNVAMMRQCHISVLVTKATGSVGGFWDKVEAARDVGATLLVIGRPRHEQGYTMEQLKQAIEEAAT